MTTQGSGLLKLVVEHLDLCGPTGPMVWDVANWSREFPDGDPVAEHLHWVEQRPADMQGVWELSDIAARRRGPDRVDAVLGLFVWSQVSAHGTDVSGPLHLRATIEKPAFEDHLLRVYDALINEGPVAAHAMMTRGTCGDFTDLSQGQATTFLFFAGYGEVPSYSLQLLVLDGPIGLALHTSEPSLFSDPRCGENLNTYYYKEYLSSVEWLCHQDELPDYPPDALARLLSRIGEALRSPV
jgi:hypothetical protein